MHWQQYVTLGLGVIGGLVSLIKFVAGSTPQHRVNGAVEVILVGGYQAMLFSGGWYGY